MVKLCVVVIGVLLMAAQADDQLFGVRSSYNKVNDTTTVSAEFFFPKGSGTLDSLSLSYTFPGKKQAVYVKPKWSLWLYDRNEPGRGKQTVRVLVNDKGPAERIDLVFVRHDSDFDGDCFTADLEGEMENVLLNAKTLEFFSPGQMAGSSKLSIAQTNKLKSFIRSSATAKPAKK